MNERIRELAEQAGFLNKDEESIEYFAELIIKECAEVVYNRSGHAQPQDLLEHFGVEE